MSWLGLQVSQLAERRAEVGTSSFVYFLCNTVNLFAHSCNEIIVDSAMI